MCMQQLRPHLLWYADLEIVPINEDSTLEKINEDHPNLDLEKCNIFVEADGNRQIESDLDVILMDMVTSVLKYCR